MINENTEVTVQSDWVEYRNHNSWGTQVIKVFQQLYVPRVMAAIEWRTEDGGVRREPLSLPLDDILQFCLDAAQRTGKTQAALVQLIEGLRPNPSA